MSLFLMFSIVSNETIQQLTFMNLSSIHPIPNNLLHTLQIRIYPNTYEHVYSKIHLKLQLH